MHNGYRLHNIQCVWEKFSVRDDVCVLTAISDEPGPGGVVVTGHAVWPLQAHGLLSVYRLGVCHHCL